MTAHQIRHMAAEILRDCADVAESLPDSPTHAQAYIVIENVFEAQALIRELYLRSLN